MQSMFETVRAHCDIEERLERARDDQQVRGIWFQMLGAELARHGADVIARYEEELDRHEAVTFKLYPVSDYLRRLVVAGGLVATPERVNEGMLALHRDSVGHFAKSVLGRVLVSLVRPTPIGMFRHIERRRGHVASYGQLLVEEVSARQISITFTDEIVYVESAQLGGVICVFETCGIDVETTVEMRTKTDGVIRARW